MRLAGIAVVLPAEFASIGSGAQPIREPLTGLPPLAPLGKAGALE
jgi:hypothetical protein